MSASEISLEDLEDLGHENIAKNFVELGEEVAIFDKTLLEPLLFGAKGIMVFGRLAKNMNFGPDLLVELRRGCLWMIHCKGSIGLAVSRRDHELKVIRTNMVDDAMRELAKRGIRISDAKIEAQIRKSDLVQALEAQLSVLNGILTHVTDHVFQYKLIKDIIIQESANVRQMMKDGAHEEREMGRNG